MERITNNISSCLEELNKDNVIGLPTETVYGLAGRIDRPNAIKKIFSIKDRPFFDPLIVHISNFKEIQLISPEFDNPLVKSLANNFWPGSLTLVLPKLDNVNPLITSGLDTVGIRVPNCKLALELIKECDSPLAAPSANKFGKTSPSSAKHVIESFPLDDFLVLDGGSCEVGIESTVIRPILVSSNKYRIEILRPGIVTEEEIQEKLFSSFQLEFINITTNKSPGHLEHHYMPDVPLILVNNIKIIGSDSLTKYAIDNSINLSNCTKIILDIDPRIAARTLYEKLRDAEKFKTSCILIQKPKCREDIWVSIWDRLNRASSFIEKD